MEDTAVDGGAENGSEVHTELAETGAVETEVTEDGMVVDKLGSNVEAGSKVLPRSLSASG